MKRKITIVLIIVTISLLFAFFLIPKLNEGRRMFEGTSTMSNNDRTSDEVLKNWLINDKKFDFDNFKNTYKIEEISIKSSFEAHDIPASYIYAKGNNDKNHNTAVMVHGLLGNRLSNYPMSKMFLDLGYNVITYDQRSSGGNKAKHTSFGYLESNDTVDCVNYVVSQIDAQKKIAVWGQSMGAATVENAMDSDVFINNVDYVILDSPMENMSDMLGRNSFSDKLRKAFANIYFKKELGFSFKDQSVYHQIEDTKIPVLVVASKNDKSIPYEIEHSIFEAIRNDKKELFTVNDSGHSDIFFDHEKEYCSKVKDFIFKY